MPVAGEFHYRLNSLQPILINKSGRIKRFHNSRIPAFRTALLAAQSADYQADCRSPALLYRHFPARQRYIIEVCNPDKTIYAAYKKLSAPEIAVCPISGAIESNAYHFLFQPAFSYYGCDMRIVVLHCISINL